jgi:hypothetical protein
MTDTKKEDIKKTEPTIPNMPIIQNEKVTEKAKKEKYNTAQKKRIKEIKTYLKETGKKSTHDSELGTITLKTEVT